MTANEALNAHYLSLKTRDRNVLTKKLMIELDVTPCIIKNWRYANTAIKPIYRREISKIIGRDIFADVVD